MMSAGDTLQGRRLANVGEFYSDERQPGDYVGPITSSDPGAASGLVYYICDPHGVVGALRTHEITEHDDGTITVSPSILDGNEGGWHGYLEHGVWREV